MSDIHFIFTGGTIDSSYDTSKQKCVPNKESLIPSYLKQVIKSHPSISHETVFMLDSGEIDDKKRTKILQAVKKSSASRIIVSHGTDTMVKTLEYLTKFFPGTKKTIVLVGAMIPLKEFAQSDAGFNLGYAISEVQRLEPGIYICMNAHTFKAGEVVKNYEKARFEKKA